MNENLYKVFANNCGALYQPDYIQEGGNPGSQRRGSRSTSRDKRNEEGNESGDNILNEAASRQSLEYGHDADHGSKRFKLIRGIGADFTLKLKYELQNCKIPKAKIRMNLISSHGMKEWSYSFSLTNRIM